MAAEKMTNNVYYFYFWGYFLDPDCLHCNESSFVS